MKQRKTISLDNDDLKTLKPFLDETGNNLSLALRKIIALYKQQTSNNITEDQKKIIMIRNQIIENRIAELIPIPLFKWMANLNLGVPPLGVFRSLIEKFPKIVGMEGITIADYVKMINIYNDIFGIYNRQHVESSPDFKKIRITYESEDPENLKSAVVNFSSLLSHNPFKLKIKKIVESPGFYIIEYEQCSSEEEAHRSIKDHFGHKWLMLEDIQNNIHFWNNLFRILKADNYEDIIINRDILVQLLKSCDFSYQLNNLISSVYGVSIEETNYQQVIRMIEELLVTNGLIYKIECSDSKIRIYHKFDDENIINTVNDTIIKTLEISGQLFKIKTSSKNTVLSIA